MVAGVCAAPSSEAVICIRCRLACRPWRARAEPVADASDESTQTGHRSGAGLRAEHERVAGRTTDPRRAHHGADGHDTRKRPQRGRRERRALEPPNVKELHVSTEESSPTRAKQMAMRAGGRKSAGRKGVGGRKAAAKKGGRGMAKKASTRKTMGKRGTAKKASTRKTGAKRATGTRKTAGRKAGGRKAGAKTGARKTGGRKAAAKRSTVARKTTTRKTGVRRGRKAAAPMPEMEHQEDEQHEMD